MLVLTRKLRETIHIGDNVTITILRVKGNAVRVGIEAPREVRVTRGELPSPPPSAENAAPERQLTDPKPAGKPAAAASGANRLREEAVAEPTISNAREHDEAGDDPGESRPLGKYLVTAGRGETALESLRQVLAENWTEPAIVSG